MASLSKRLIKFSWIHLKEHCLSIKMMFHACTLNIGRLGQDDCHESVANPGHMSKFCASLHSETSQMNKDAASKRRNAWGGHKNEKRLWIITFLLGICTQPHTYVGKGMGGYTEMLKISPRYYNLLFYILQLAQSMFCTFPAMDTYQLYGRKRYHFKIQF